MLHIKVSAKIVATRQPVTGICSKEITPPLYTVDVPSVKKSCPYA
jgi:hypothetical protein